MTIGNLTTTIKANKSQQHIPGETAKTNITIKALKDGRVQSNYIPHLISLISLWKKQMDLGE